ncbi:MAG: hypothetical protein DWQ37_13650 [Planctomycetota bacterium]|nr:MAG: hypothetical protein DWQ37_13650 [Planctomycetota bacterium]
MPRYSVVQVLVAVGALSAGLALWRLSGDRTDVPLVVLGLYFLAGLCHHAAATQRQLAEQPSLPRDQRWGGRLLCTELLLAATALLLGLVIHFLRAAGVTPWLDEDEYLDFLTLNGGANGSDLAVLAMLVAIWLGAPSSARTVRPWPVRYHVYAAIAAVCGLIVAVIYAADRMLLWLLVSIATWAVEAGLRPTGPVETLPQAILVDRFTIGTLVGVCLMVANLLLVGVLVEGWRRLAWRRLALLLLVVGFAAEGMAARWIVDPGLRQLCPSFYEAIAWPSPTHSVIAGAFLLLGSTVLALRMVAQRALDEESHRMLRPRKFFHERWPAGLLLALFTLTRLTMTATYLINHVSGPWTDFLWLSAAITGFSFAWNGFRRRNEPVDGSFPCVAPFQFGAVVAAAILWFAISAPILAAAGYSYWCVEFEMGSH